MSKMETVSRPIYKIVCNVCKDDYYYVESTNKKQIKFCALCGSNNDNGTVLGITRLETTCCDPFKSGE